MSKFMKKRMNIVLAGGLAVAMLAGCGNKDSEKKSDDTASNNTVVENNATENDTTDQENVPDEVNAEENENVASTDPMEMILEGRYAYAFSAEGYGDYVSYFHFYEEDPVLGAVFYVGYLNNQTTFTGTYEVLEEECSYLAAPSREDDVQEGSAPYTIVFYDWSGNEVDRCAYDGDIIYNDLDVITGYGGGNEFYYHDVDIENSQYADAYATEMGVAYLEFVVEDDEYSGITLNHNMTYVDLTGMIVEGTWTMKENTDGGYDYTLVPYDSSDTGAVVSVAEDKMTATYLADGNGEQIKLIAVANELAVIAQYDGTCIAYEVECPLSLRLYDDGTCELIADVFGNVGAVDTGTYEATEAGCLLHMAYGGDMDAGYTVHYIGSNDLGEMDSELTLVQ